MATSERFGEALAAELPALLGRANAIAPNRVQGGSQRSEDPGAGTTQRQVACTALRKLATLWARDRSLCVAWWLWFVRTAPSARNDRAVRLVHMLSIEREERIELLSHASGPDEAGAIKAGRDRVAAVRAAFDDAHSTPSGGSWLNELVRLADGAADSLERDARAAMGVRLARSQARKVAKKARAA